MTPTPGPRLEAGTTLTHRRYVDYSHAHYAGNLVDGAYVVGLFGDIATDLCLSMDGDEGLFASYSDITFHAPVRAGDVLEVTARVEKIGNRSRTIAFDARAVIRTADGSTSTGQVLDEPLTVVTATGTVVVPVAGARGESK